MKKGFTILETILVVAISTLLFMSVAGGISVRIASSRYETAVRELEDFLGNVYTEALNTENARQETEGARNYCTLASAVAAQTTAAANGEAGYENYPGRTNCAVYGKAMVFGGEDGMIYVFDLVGDAVEYAVQSDTRLTYGEQVAGIPLSDIRGLSRLGAMKAVHLDYLAIENESGGICTVAPAGRTTVYEPNWGAKLKAADGSDFIGIVLVSRSPVDGAVSTYVYEGEDAPELARMVEGNYSVACEPDGNSYSGLLSTGHFWSSEVYETRLDGFTSSEATELGFCVRTEDYWALNSKRYISFTGSGQNANAIYSYDADDEITEAKCQ